jgi:aconitate hydratase
MAENLSCKLIRSKLADGVMAPGEEIALRIDQVLLQDVLGALVMLELEAMGIDKVHPELSVQYVDHSLVQQDHVNPDSHLFLKSACERFGIWYSGPGNGISHPVHMERFGIPGKSMVGCDSHTPAAGSLGMLAIGAGGVEVALALAGEPLYLPMPRIFGVRLSGALPDWVSAKDIILEMLRRHGVAGAKNMIIEYYGPGLAGLSAMDRHVLANMGTEMGATSTVFPSDEAVRRFLRARGREDVWVALAADEGCTYDLHDEIDLSRLEPLIALPSSPDKVVPVREVAGQPVYQSYVGSSANPGYRDFAIVSAMLRDNTVAAGVSLDINPSSREVLETLLRDGYLGNLLHAGSRLHQAGCNGCIGMGQAPARGRNSLRTVPRNFAGRSGTREDSVFLCSPETAAASAIRGVITDPRDLGMPYPRIEEPETAVVNPGVFVPPAKREPGSELPALYKTDNTPSLPQLPAFDDDFDAPVLLKVGDNITTDDIMPAGARVLPYWSNVFESSRFAFDTIDPSYPERAKAQGQATGHFIVGGKNYGQGSSRENAALIPRLLGVQAVLAISFARIHWQNLVSFGILPLTFSIDDDYQALKAGERLHIGGLRKQLLKGGGIVEAERVAGGRHLVLRHELTSRQIEILFAGGVINWLRLRDK